MKKYADELVVDGALARKLSRINRISLSLAKDRVKGNASILSSYARARKVISLQIQASGLEGTVSEFADLWSAVRRKRKDKSAPETLKALNTLLEKV